MPEDVAVVGIGNDTITCEFCEVPLSSVARSNRDVGYEAAALLDRLMASRRRRPMSYFRPKASSAAARRKCWWSATGM